MLTEKTKQKILTIQKKYPEKRSALIPALHLAQAEVGFLPYDVQREVATLFDIDVNEVNSVVSFYDMFHDKPLGKHIIHVCKNVSCMLKGCDGLIDNLCHKLQVKPGEVSADGEFTVIPSECLGACDLAPMMLVDDKVVGNVKEDQLDAIISAAKKCHGHSCPVPDSEVSHG